MSRQLTAVAALVALFALPLLTAQKTPAKPAELVKLETEVVKVRTELEAARKLATAKAELAALKAELVAVRRGKTKPSPGIVKKRATSAEITRLQAELAEVRKRVIPEWVPKLALDEIRAMQDPAGGWWTVESRFRDNGLMSLNAFGRGEIGRLRAEEFVEIRLADRR